MRLLVSVRNAAEAGAAARGGAQIIDLKEPLRGPLGMVPPPKWTEILSSLIQNQAEEQSAWTSLALGEVKDWLESEPVSLPPVNFAKLGLAGLAESADLAPWLETRQRFNQITRRPPGWVAVIYADYQLARAPAPELIVEHAIESACVGVLCDTWDKSAGKLWDSLTPLQLQPLIEQTRAAGLFFAVAGRLTAADVNLAKELGADVFAVRSAACTGQDRSLAVNCEAVRQLAIAMQAERIGSREVVNSSRATS